MGTYCSNNGELCHEITDFSKFYYKYYACIAIVYHSGLFDAHSIASFFDKFELVSNNLFKLIHLHIYDIMDDANNNRALTLDNNLDGLAKDCCNSSALALEYLQSCAKPSI